MESYAINMCIRSGILQIHHGFPCAFPQDVGNLGTSQESERQQSPVRRCAGWSVGPCCWDYERVNGVLKDLFGVLMEFYGD